MEDIKSISEFVKDLDVDRFRSLPLVLELNPAGINKGTGLLSILNEYNRNNFSIYVAGDGENDLPLFDLSEIPMLKRIGYIKLDGVETALFQGIFSENLVPSKIRKGKKVKAIFNIEREGKMTDFFFVPEDEYENWISKPEYEGGE